MNGYIKLHRKILEWEWFDNPNTLKLFIFLLLSVSHKGFRYCGISLKAGQIITGRKKLAAKLNLTEREIRTALEHLKKTGEISLQTTNRYSIITINNWDLYQGTDLQETDNRPLNNKGKKVKKNWVNQTEEMRTSAAYQEFVPEGDVWEEVDLAEKRKKINLYKKRTKNDE